MRYLHEQGVDIRALSDKIAMLAAQNGHLNVLRYLHEQGADIRGRTDYAMRCAARHGRLDVVRYLHEQGADIRANDDQATRSAAENGHLDVLRYLHEHGANIRVGRDIAVRGAAERGYLAVVRYLHEQGADIREDDDRAAQLAVQHGRLAVMNYLHQHGARLPPGVEETFGDWRKWNALHGRCPAGLGRLSPYLFKPQAFDDVVAMLEHESYKDIAAHRYAYHAAGLFGTTDRVLSYLEKWGGYSHQPLHDIIQHIELPQSRFKVAAWGDAVLRHGPKMARLVKFADNLPEPLKDSRGQWSYTLTRAEIAKNAYKRGADCPELAALCFEQTWTEKQFERALAEVEKYHARYGAEGRKSDKRIPYIRIDGAAFGRPGYRFEKLPDGDVRGLLLGEFTNCCQHMGGAGSSCAKHGFLSEQGGFYVVTDPKDNIVAQSWAWRGDKDELVLDSLEQLPGRIDAGQWRSLCDQFAIAAQEDKSAHVKAVHIGKGGATPAMDYPSAAKPANPLDYDGYRDSKKQYRVAGTKHGAAPL